MIVNAIILIAAITLTCTNAFTITIRKNSLQLKRQEIIHTALHQSRPRENGSINSIDISSSSCIDSNSSTTRYLQWDMIKLIRQDRDKEEDSSEFSYAAYSHGDKIKSLMAVLEAAVSENAHGSNDETVETEMEMEAEQEIALPDHFVPLRRFLRHSSKRENYNHQGCFRIFHDDEESSSSSSSISFPSNLLFSMDRPFSFIRDSLSYHSNASRDKKGGMMCDNSEAVVWCSNHNYSSNGYTGTRNSELECASRVLDDMPFAQLYMGSSAISGMGKDNGNDRKNGADKIVNGGISSSDGASSTSTRNNEDGKVFELDLETIGILESMGVLLEVNAESKNDSSNSGDMDMNMCGTMVRCHIKSRDLEVIQAVLSSHESINDNSKSYQEEKQHPHPHDHPQEQMQTIIKMINVAVNAIKKDPLNQSNEPHLVLMAHSISASMVACAISTWKREKLRSIDLGREWDSQEEQQQQQHQAKSRIEDLLHQAVTVITFGNVSRMFCDGPAYIHISMWDDPWTNALGSMKTNSKSGGRGAVYFHAWSPYEYDSTKSGSSSSTSTSSNTNTNTNTNLKSHNAHNLNACILQYLCLIMRINGIASFRALYDSARYIDPRAVLDINPKHFAVEMDYGKHGDLVIPSRIDDELLPAMILATGGDKWLFRHDSGDGDDYDEDGGSCLPDEIEATSHLEESFGYSAYEEIYETCCCTDDGCTPTTATSWD